MKLIDGYFKYDNSYDNKTIAISKLLLGIEIYLFSIIRSDQLFELEFELTAIHTINYPNSLLCDLYLSSNLLIAYDRYFI